MQTLSRFLVRRHRWCLALAALIGLVSIHPARQLSFDRSIENMFSPDDPLLEPYRRLQSRFNGNQVILLVYEDPDWRDVTGAGIQRVADLSDKCLAVPGVQAVLSLSELNRLLESSITLVERFTKPDSASLPILKPAPSIGATIRDLFVGLTHGEEGGTLAIVCLLSPSADGQVSPDRAETVAKLRVIADAAPSGNLVGEPVMVEEGFDLVESDGQRLAWGTLILLSATLLILFRNLRWMIIPLVLLAWSLVTTRAILHISGMQLTMVSSMLTAIIMVIAVATVVHFVLRYREYRATGSDVAAAIEKSLSLLLVPVSWACLTDAVGFISLKMARVGPVHDFGVMMALGATLVLLGALLLIPGLAQVGRFGRDPKDVWGESRLKLGLTWLLQHVQRNATRWLLGILLLVSLAATGIVRLEVETDFTRNFRRSSRIVRGYEQVEEHLGGAGVWDAVIPAPAVIDRAYLDRVTKWKSDLRAIEVASEDGSVTGRITNVISFADMVAAADDSPIWRLTPVPLRANRMAQQMPSVVGSLWWRNEDGGALRVFLRAKERLPAGVKLRLIDAVQEATDAAFGDAVKSEVEPEVTGFYVLLANLIRSLLRDQWICFACATCGIWLMMTMAFRSWRLALVALIPNILPIFFLLGVMGHLGIQLNMGAAMIAAVSVGLSVDSSIHYGISYLRARRSQQSRSESLRIAQQTVGRALVFATLALVIGFSMLCMSQLVPTVYFGALASLAMLGGLAGNLILLPLLILLSRA